MRLNLGSGPCQPADWTNVDPDPKWGAEVNANPRYGLPWIAGVADGAVAHHSLMFVAYPDLLPWLREVRRVLKPGAYLRLSVPDLDLAHLWLTHGGDRPLPPIADEHETSVDGKVCMWLSQAGATRSVFTSPWLVELCLRAGFAHATAADWQGWGLDDPAHHRHSGTGPAWLYDLDLSPDRRDESLYVDAIA